MYIHKHTHTYEYIYGKFVKRRPFLGSIESFLFICYSMKCMMFHSLTTLNSHTQFNWFHAHIHVELCACKRSRIHTRTHKQFSLPLLTSAASAAFHVLIWIFSFRLFFWSFSSAPFFLPLFHLCTSPFSFAAFCLSVMYSQIFCIFFIRSCSKTVIVYCLKYSTIIPLISSRSEFMSLQILICIFVMCLWGMKRGSVWVCVCERDYGIECRSGRGEYVRRC